MAIASRLRREIGLSIKRIAARMRLDAAMSANARLHEWMLAKE
jgi:hypothetical protein